MTNIRTLTVVGCNADGGGTYAQWLEGEDVYAPSHVHALIGDDDGWTEHYRQTLTGGIISAPVAPVWFDDFALETPPNAPRVSWNGDTDALAIAQPDGTYTVRAVGPMVAVVVDRPAVIADAVARSKSEILADVAAGVVPAHVESFGELHDYVDANEYGGLCDECPPIDWVRDETGAVNEVQNAVHAWILAGGVRA